MKYCYFNGKIISENKTRVNPRDLGILRGYGVFDVMRIYNGKPFLLPEHFKRLKNSASKLNLKIPIGEKKFKETVLKLIKKNKVKSVIIRTVVTGSNTFYILSEKFTPLPSGLYKNGAKLITLPYARYIPESKTLNYISFIKQKDNMKRRGALELLYISEGKVLECATSNFFIIKKGVVITPKNGVLKGTTRGLVLKLARKNNFKVEEQDVKISELETADEAFLAATNKGIVPVVKIDNRKIRNGKVGEKTKLLINIFNDYVREFKK